MMPMADALSIIQFVPKYGLLQLINIEWACTEAAINDD